MANEKSRNHDTKGGKDGASKHQGRPGEKGDAGSKADTKGQGDGSRSGGSEDKPQAGR